MPENTTLPVTVTRSAGAITVQMDPRDIIGFRQEDDQVTRVSLTLDGEEIAVLQKFAAGQPAGTTPGLGLTQEEATRFIPAVNGGVSTRENPR